MSWVPVKNIFYVKFIMKVCRGVLVVHAGVNIVHFDHSLLLKELFPILFTDPDHRAQK